MCVVAVMCMIVVMCVVVVICVIAVVYMIVVICVVVAMCMIVVMCIVVAMYKIVVGHLGYQVKARTLNFSSFFYIEECFTSPLSLLFQIFVLFQSRHSAEYNVN